MTLWGLILSPGKHLIKARVFNSLLGDEYEQYISFDSPQLETNFNILIHLSVKLINSYEAYPKSQPELDDDDLIQIDQA